MTPTDDGTMANAYDMQVLIYRCSHDSEVKYHDPYRDRCRLAVMGSYNNSDKGDGHTKAIESIFYCQVS